MVSLPFSVHQSMVPPYNLMVLYTDLRVPTVREIIKCKVHCFHLAGCGRGGAAG
jgi:hypothetical protein